MNFVIHAEKRAKMSVYLYFDGFCTVNKYIISYFVVFKNCFKPVINP